MFGVAPNQISINSVDGTSGQRSVTFSGANATSAYNTALGRFNKDNLSPQMQQQLGISGAMAAPTTATPTPSSSDDSGSKTVIIAAAAGGGGAFLLLVLFFVYRSQQNKVRSSGTTHSEFMNYANSEMEHEIDEVRSGSVPSTT